MTTNPRANQTERQFRIWYKFLFVFISHISIICVVCCAVYEHRAHGLVSRPLTWIRCWHGFLKWCTLIRNLMKTNILLDVSSLRVLVFFFAIVVATFKFVLISRQRQWVLMFIKDSGSFEFGLESVDETIFFRIFIFISEWDHSNFAIKIVETNEFLIFFLYLLASPNWLLCVRMHSRRTRVRPQYRNRILPRPDISTPTFIRITLQYLFTILNEAYLLGFFFHSSTFCLC